MATARNISFLLMLVQHCTLHVRFSTIDKLNRLTFMSEIFNQVACVNGKCPSNTAVSRSTIHLWKPLPTTHHPSHPKQFLEIPHPNAYSTSPKGKSQNSRWLIFGQIYGYIREIHEENGINRCNVSFEAQSRF